MPVTKDDETREILNDPETMELIREAEEDIRNGRMVPGEEMRLMVHAAVCGAIGRVRFGESERGMAAEIIASVIEFIEYHFDVDDAFGPFCPECGHSESNHPCGGCYCNEYKQGGDAHN